jgi:hypothetical protein
MEGTKYLVFGSRTEESFLLVYDAVHRRCGKRAASMFTTDQSNFFHFNNQRPSTKLPIQWIPWTLSLGIKQADCKAEHLPPSRVEVKNPYRYAITSPHTSSWRHISNTETSTTDQPRASNIGFTYIVYNTEHFYGLQIFHIRETGGFTVWLLKQGKAFPLQA